MEKFLASDCDIVSQLSELGIYDYIVVQWNWRGYTERGLGQVKEESLPD